MSTTGRSNACPKAERGFTLVELLAVMIVLALAVTTVAVTYRGSSSGLAVSADARIIASRLRDLRNLARSTRTLRRATIDVAERVLWFDDGKPELRLTSSARMVLTAAESEMQSQVRGGVRFFANGSSTGVTLALRTEKDAHEIRVNWLTGRVSTRRAPDAEAAASGD